MGGSEELRESRRLPERGVRATVLSPPRAHSIPQAQGSGHPGLLAALAAC